MPGIKGKKAMELHEIVLILVAVVAIFFVVGLFIVAFNKTGDIEKCRLSALAADKIKLAGKVLPSLDCPRQEVTIKYKDVAVSGKIDQNKINYKLAEQMRVCWYKMGEGKLDSFNNALIIAGKTNCIVCSQISFEDKLKTMPAPFAPSEDWLKTTPMIDSDIKYYDYLTFGQSSLSFPASNHIDFHKPYYVIYSIYGIEETNKVILDNLFPNLWTIMGCDQGSCNKGVHLIEGNDVNTICNNLYNERPSNIKLK